MDTSSDDKVRIYHVPESTADRPIVFSTNRKRNRTYVYLTTEKVYLQDKKYNENKRVLIGYLVSMLPENWKKEDSSSPLEMIPNDHFKEYFPLETWVSEITQNADNADNDTTDTDDCHERTHNDFVKVGSYLIIEGIVEQLQLKEHLKSAGFDEKTVVRILDFATYMIIEEENAAIHYNYYAYEHSTFEEGKGISDETIGRMFKSISLELIHNFLKKWNDANIANHKKSKLKSTIYISGDGTNTSSQAGDIDLVEYGAAKIDDGNPIINMMLAVDMVTKLPLFYDLYNGSINDLTECIYMFNQILAYGYGADLNIGAILDRGFFGRENIKYFDDNKIHFMVMAKGWKRFIRSQVLDVVLTFEFNDANYIPRYDVYGITIQAELFGKQRWCHVYFNNELISHDQSEFRKKLERWENQLKDMIETKKVVDQRSIQQLKLFFNLEFNDKNVLISYTRNEKEIENEYKLAGHFAIVTSDEMTAKEALTTYKSRDVNEKLNMSSKTFLGNRTYRISDSEHLAGKGLVVFIAMIIRQAIHIALEEEQDKKGKPNQLFEVPTALLEIEKMCVIKYANGVYALRTGMTAKQKKILKACHMTEAKAITKIQKLSERFTKEAKEDDERRNR